MIPWWETSKSDFHFKYDLSGGSMMAMGTYNFSALLLIFDALPEECLSCDTNAYTDVVHDKCDWDFKAKFRFPHGGICEVQSTLSGPTFWNPSSVTVRHGTVIVDDETLPVGQEKVRTRDVAMYRFIHAISWHRVNVKDVFKVRGKDDGKVVRRWEEKKSHKAYSCKEAGGEFADFPVRAFGCRIGISWGSS
ncbi:hypothetical protein BBP40_008596 [Aspergillus hancockii]|nr:hypothetical protein BBP40_008596 [Aspergillus hancockii]